METTDFQTVIVVWADAHSDGDGWTPRDELGQDGELLVRTCGWLLPVGEGGKEGHVTVAQSITPHDDVDHVIHIPTGMTRTVSFLQPFTRDILLSS